MTERRLILPLLFTVFLMGSACAQSTSNSSETGQVQYRLNSPTDNLYEYDDFITESFLMRHLTVIAHDSMAGREAGMPGQKKTATYLSGFYQELGMTPMGQDGFMQPFLLNAEQTDSLVFELSAITGGETELINRSVTAPGELSQFIRIAGGAEPLSGDIVFAGFGVTDSTRGVDHLSNGNIEGKWVLIFDEIPYVVNGDTLVDPLVSQSRRFNTIVSEYGAHGVLVISQGTQNSFSDRSELISELVNKPSNMRLAYLDSSTQSSAGQSEAYLEVSPEIAAELLGLSSEGSLEAFRQSIIEGIADFRPMPLTYHLDYRAYEGTRQIQSENVVAMLEGGDPELKEEVVVLMGHYDHIGLVAPNSEGDMIGNGADDNGSGTSAILSVANALSQAAQEGIRPDRSILFLHVSAEEKGLLGSRYYSDHPLVPIEKTVANFNADMIGRSDDRNINQGDTDYVYIIGGDIISTELDSLVHVANGASTQMRLDYFYNDLQDPNQFYRRSDHWNFGRLGVPFVFFFAGVHEDYHQPSDHVEKLDMDKLTRIARLLYGSTIEVANYNGAPAVDNQEFIDITRIQPR